MDNQRSPATALDLQLGCEAGPALESPALTAAALAAEPTTGQADLLSEPVPHAQPLTMEPPTTGPLTDEQLNQQISETFTETHQVRPRPRPEHRDGVRADRQRRHGPVQARRAP